jgi:phenylpyruvate tautomerase PptA (4-oxalocrotonate tautomerase family)
MARADQAQETEHMAKYTVTIPKDLVTKSVKDDIATSILRIHREAAGASENVQVIIGDVEPGCFYQHGRLLECDHIFLHGFILQDRSRDTKSVLTERLSSDIAARASIDQDSVCIYFSEMSPGEMEQFDRYNAIGPAGGSS